MGIGACTPYTRAVALIFITAILISSSLAIISPVNAQLPLPPGVKREDVVILDIIHGRTPTPDQFNAWVPGIPVGHFHQLCLDSLWYTNLSSGLSVDVLASGLPEYRDEFKTMIVKLRNDVYWSDGEKFTSRDLVFTVNACAGNPNLGCHATITTWVESVRAIDDYTVEFKLKSPNPYFHYAFTIQTWGAIYMMPAHYFEKIGIENIHTDKFYPPICIGPYVLHSYDPGGMWFLFKRRDDYLRSSMGHIVKRFNWPGGPEWVLMRGFINEQAKLMALYAGELDTMFDPSPEAFRAVLASMGGRIRAWQPEWPYFWGHDPTVRGIYFNKAKYPYNLTEVRWALTLAVNITKVMVESWEGIQRLVAVPAAASLFSDLKWSEALLPWLKEFYLTLPDGTKFYPFDPDIPMRIYNWAKAKGY
ncbi:MAG: ABC transporter substrate-binding protein, partial [Ignisphaera sp.]